MYITHITAGEKRHAPQKLYKVGIISRFENEATNTHKGGDLR